MLVALPCQCSAWGSSNDDYHLGVEQASVHQESSLADLEDVEEATDDAAADKATLVEPAVSLVSLTAAPQAFIQEAAEPVVPPLAPVGNSNIAAAAAPNNDNIIASNPTEAESNPTEAATTTEAPTKAPTKAPTTLAATTTEAEEAEDEEDDMEVFNFTTPSAPVIANITLPPVAVNITEVPFEVEVTLPELPNMTEEEEGEKRNTLFDHVPEEDDYRRCHPRCEAGRGICHDSVCFCKHPYNGEACEKEIREDIMLSWAISMLVFVVCVLAGMGIAVVLFRQYLDAASERRGRKFDELKNVSKETWKRQKDVEAGEHEGSTS